MEKAIVIGSPGAGKSRFARNLSALTKLPLIHLDLIWLNSDKTTITPEIFDQALAEILQQNQWIIDGNYARTLETRLAACETVFLLDYPLTTCLAGVQARIGKPRSDMPWVESSFDEEFKQWIIAFHHEQLPKIKQQLARYRSTKNVWIFQTRQAAADYLTQLEQHD